MLRTLPKGKIVIHKMDIHDYLKSYSRDEVRHYKKYSDYYECKVIIQEVVVNDFSKTTEDDDENEVTYFVEPYEEFKKKNIYNNYSPCRIPAYEDELTNPSNKESDE